MTLFCCLGSGEQSPKTNKTPVIKETSSQNNKMTASGAPSTATATETKKTKKAPHRESVVTVGATKWLQLKTIDYTDEDGVSRKWDVATRATKQSDVPDAVVIIPIMKSKKNKIFETLIVEQYRPPLEKYALEFPAGLIDQGETAQIAALRELHEETGYIGTIEPKFQSDELCMSPGLSDETIQIVVVNIDLDDPRNINPKQQLEDGEAVVVKRVPLSLALKDALGKSKSMPISMLYSFALGLEIGAKYFSGDV